MRFLFGIFIGAALTLLIATTTDAPTNPVLNRVTDLWDQLIDTTSQQLFETRSAAGLTASGNHKPDVSDRMETAATPITPLPTPQQATDFNEPLPTTQPEQIAETLQPTEQAEENTQTLTEAMPDFPMEILTDMASEVTPEAATADLEASLADNRIATVWVPFHSERSANGFADTLSRHFEYPFSVRRNGPGAYQVTFRYADLAKREDLLGGIAELTGK
jgi:hypothetical protein